ncbi:hypothetical protein ACFYYH_33380 [Streptomyces sp. NPDC002018]|uniref:hypothetical protein n=1 Tax=Streptomyces sp. NPDC002018 TaxID=3364629 RepID=UPI0036B17964
MPTGDFPAGQGLGSRFHGEHARGNGTRRSGRALFLLAFATLYAAASLARHGR